MSKALILAFVMMLSASAVVAQELRLVVGFGRILDFDQPVENIFVGTDAVVDVQPVSDTRIFVTGSSPGFTNLIVMNEFEEVILSRSVNVVPESNSTSGILRQLIPSGSVNLRRIGDTDIIVGTARTIEEAYGVIDLRGQLEADGRRVIDNSSVASPYQVGLRVRIVELFREELQRLGFDITALAQGNRFRVVTGSGTAGAFLAGAVGNIDGSTRIGANADIGNLDVNAVLDALQQRGVVKIVSEPVLTTVSGRPASFRSGSEFATPVNQGNGVFTNEFRTNGIEVDFLPTVQPDNRILLEINPRLSFAGPTGSNDRQVREVSTTVEVTSGQTIAIAGLQESLDSQNVSSLPGIFRRISSARTQTRNEREIVFFVTPYLSDGTTRPGPKPKHLRTIETIGFIVR